MANLPRTWKPSIGGWPKLPVLSSVRGRIIAGFGLTILILAGVAFVSAWQVRSHRGDMAEASEHATTASFIEDARFEVTLANMLLERYIVTGNEGVVPVIRSSTATAIDSLAEALADEEMRGDEDEIAALNAITSGAAFFAETTEEVIALRQSGDVEGARAILEAASPDITEFGIALGEAAQFERQEASALRDHADRTANLAFWLLVVSSAAGGTLGIVVSLLIARSIIKPLSSLESTALAVAGGDLEARAQATGPRELARLGASFNRMTDSLLKDISERKRAEEELRRLNQELEADRKAIEALNRSLEAKVRERTQELRRANEELQERHRQLLDARAQAATDQLTGLSNHRAFQERVREEVRRAQENGNSIGLIMLDIDDFKRVNDSLGHLAGDQVLRELAVILADVVRQQDVYRYGGDEFAVLLPALNRRKTTRLAERLRRAVERRTDGSAEKITVSLGVASFLDTAGSVEELMYGADAAMYWAKSAGKNRVADWGKLVGHRADGTLPWYAADRGVKAPDVVAALVAALSAKDPVTSAHTERCSWYALKLAEELGLGEEETPIVRLASLLHDIGKLAIPDEVLFKPGPLNEEEWVQMKQHPTAALHVLGQIRSVHNATPAILHHHEHFDGSGYPDGLAGEEIPIASRILLVTDAFDAMTTDRPYRKAMSIEAAIAELKDYSGSQFDPAVVEAFLQMLAREGARPLSRRVRAQAGRAAAAPRRRPRGAPTLNRQASRKQPASQ